MSASYSLDLTCNRCGERWHQQTAYRYRPNHMVYGVEEAFTDIISEARGDGWRVQGALIDSCDLCPTCDEELFYSLYEDSE